MTDPQKRTFAEFEDKEKKHKQSIAVQSLISNISNDYILKGNVVQYLKDKNLINSKTNPRNNTIKEALMKIEDINVLDKLKQGTVQDKSYQIPIKGQEFSKQQNPPSKKVQSVRKGGTGEAMSQSEMSIVAPKKMSAKQQIQPEESKEENKSIRSVKGSIRDDESSMSQGSVKSSQVHQLLETLANDSKLSRRIPQINQVKQNALKGNISDEQKYQQISQAIMENMNSSKVVNSMVMDIVNQQIKGESSSQKSSKSVKSQSSKSAYGGFAQLFDEDDAQRNDQNNNLGGSDELIKPMIKPVFVQAEVKNDVVAIYKDHLQKIAAQHGGAVSQKAEEMIKQIERSTFEAEEAVDSIQEPHIPEQHEPVQEVVTGMLTAPQLQPQVHTITDFLEMPQFGAWLEVQINKAGLTDEQRDLTIRTLRDVDSANDLVSQQLKDLGYDDKSVVRSVKGKNKSAKGMAQGLDMNSDSTSGISKQIKGLDPKSRQSSQLFSVGNHQITEEFIKETMQQTIDKISKIVGDIPTIATYSTFQKQTEVFGTKIKKKESNAFAVKQGSAFRLRQCQ